MEILISAIAFLQEGVSAGISVGTAVGRSVRPSLKSMLCACYPMFLALFRCTHASLKVCMSVRPWIRNAFSKTRAMRITYVAGIGLYREINRPLSCQARSAFFVISPVQSNVTGMCTLFIASVERMILSCSLVRVNYISLMHMEVSEESSFLN